MKIINYPLLYFQLKENAVLGILVGTDYQVIEKDLRSVKAMLQDYLQKQYKKFGDYDPADIEVPRLKIFDVKIRPRTRTNRGAYASSTVVKVSVPAVYGEAANGQHLCFLPLLEDYFYYYDARQFKSLAAYFAMDFYNRLSPEEIYRHLQYPTPQLDTVTLRVKDRFDSRWNSYDYTPRYETLEKLAERYPYPKAIRRNQNQFPEAAWELEPKVNDVVERILKVKSNVLIVGKHGVGKSAVLKQAIRKITSKAKKEKISLSFWRIMAQRITASSKYLGEWQETFENLIDELAEASGVLWIENVIQLLQTGGSGPEDSVAAFMINFLHDDRFQVIGEMTDQELESMRRFLPGFVECFQIVRIEELREKQIQSVMNLFAEFCEKNLKVKIPQESIMLSYRLLLRYYPYESFPGKAVRFFQQCVHAVKLEGATTVTQNDVIQNFTQQTGLPELFLRDDLLLQKKDLREYFNSKIIGQPDAIENLVDVVTVFKAGLNNPKKPISTMLFAGPTGVGKTASAKALANYFFGKGQKKNPLVRIDMSEFQHPGQIIRLIGAGRQVGKLVQEIREKPFAVLLLDEVEKASPSIFDALLTMLDEGVLVDAFGRVTNFRNTIVIMTTNLGATNRKSISYRDTSSDEAKYMSAIGGFFRPEFVNRIDNIVMFNSLKKNDIRQILQIELDALKQREGFLKRNLDLSFSPTVFEHLAKIGFDEKYGARPLHRAIEQQIVGPISNWLLENTAAKDGVLMIDFEGEVKIRVRR